MCFRLILSAGKSANWMSGHKRIKDQATPDDEHKTTRLYFPLTLASLALGDLYSPVLADRLPRSDLAARFWCMERTILDFNFGLQLCNIPADRRPALSSHLQILHTTSQFLGQTW